jgi:glycosyltransferase involved in cell wall biosynthesis
MTTLRVIIDDMLQASPGGSSRSTEELTRALVESAPRGCTVEGFVSASSPDAYTAITDRLPGLGTLHKSPLARRELMAAWQHGFTRLPGNGMVHAPSLFAPLARHYRLNDGDQIAVTIHDTLAWTHPESLSPKAVSWYKSMAKRAHKYADAIVTPSHAVATHLSELFDFGDRIRVISGAPSALMIPPVDRAERAENMKLPERYVLAIGFLEPRRGIDQLVSTFASVEDNVPLVIVGPQTNDPHLTETLKTAGLSPDRVMALGKLSTPDLAVVLDRATVFAYPNLEEGFGMPMLEAFALGTPVVHSDAPALMELAADAGVVVERDGDGYPERLADAINSVLQNPELAKRLSYSGSDRAQLFSWRNAAEKVWQLHADL